MSWSMILLEISSLAKDESKLSPCGSLEIIKKAPKWNVVHAGAVVLLNIIYFQK